MKLVFLGPPGAGKGTQAKLLASDAGLLHLSTGDMLRSAIQRGTETGLSARSFMEKGQLVPDRVVDALVKERLTMDDAQAGYILDGYPRNLAQVEVLSKAAEIDAALFLDVEDEILVQRILGRGEGRKDDTEEVVRDRLTVYREQTEPLVGYYRMRGLLHEIDGDRSIDDVSSAVRAAVGGLIR